VTTLLAICLNLLILGVLLWVISMCLEMVVEGAGLPPRIKPVVLAIVGLLGLIAILGGYRITL
jgi:hypothetical protein